MRFLIQVVKKASVDVDNKTIGKIDKGFLIFVGVNDSDTKEIADKMIKKTVGLRIFEDENGKTNLSIGDITGSMLVISQFTLYADCRKGNRPSFIKAGDPSHASGMEMNAIASSIIGGTMLTGGVGNIIGTFVGVLSLGTIQNVVASAGFDDAWWIGISTAGMLCLFIIIQSVVVSKKKKLLAK